MRIPSELADQGVRFETLPHAPAYCASRRARLLHVPGRQVAKAVLLTGPDGFLLAVLRSTHEIDLDELSRRRGGLIRLARAEELSHVFAECERGAVPALGHLFDLPTILDAAIGADEDLFFGMGSHFADVVLTCRDFEDITGAVRLDFARPISPR
jgi:Ala-tRNA(Pro) deacylase